MPMYSSGCHVAPSSREYFTMNALWTSVVACCTYAKMQRIDALSWTRIGITTVSATARGPGTWNE
jgi:hypothetical protein